MTGLNIIDLNDPLGTRAKAKQSALENRLHYELNAKELFRRIDAIPGLTGAAVIYIDKNFTVVKLRPFSPVCQTNKVSVILNQ